MISPAPTHTRLRKLVTAAFTRRSVEGLQPAIQAISTELLGPVRTALDAGERVDIVSAYAFPFAFRVLCTLLGIPRQDEAALAPLFTVLAQTSAASVEQFRSAAGEMQRFLRALIADKEREPADDLLSELIAARDGGDRLTGDELTAMTYVLVIAGHETTASLITNGLMLLLHHRDQLDVLCAHPERVPDAIEEMLRYDSPVQATVPTYAAEPLEIGGQRIETGEVVTVSPLAASLATAPGGGAERFDVGREDRPTSPSGTACITAWAPRWPGWRPASPSRSSSPGLPDIEPADGS